MKKKSTLVALATLFVGLSSQVMADESVAFDFKSMDIYKTDAIITADGIDNEEIWSSASVTEQVADRFLDVNVTNTTGYALKYKAVYDDDYLYMFIKVTDAAYVPYDKAIMTGETNVDNIELYFSPLDERGSSDISYLPGLKADTESQLRISVGSDSYASGTGYAKASIDTDGKISGYRYVTKQVDGGYNIEVMLSWDIVVADKDVDKIAEGNKIFFDLEGADCIDYTAGRKVILGWSGDDYFAWKRNSKYGEMNFKGMAGGTGIDTKEVASVKYTFTNNELSLMDIQPNAGVAIYDLSGRNVASMNYDGSAINLANLLSGVYLVQVENAGNFKIVK